MPNAPVVMEGMPCERRRSCTGPGRSWETERIEGYQAEIYLVSFEYIIAHSSDKLDLFHMLPSLLYKLIL